MLNFFTSNGTNIKNNLLYMQRICFVSGVCTIPIMTGRLRFPIADNHLAYIFITLGILIFGIESYLYPNSLTGKQKNIIKFLLVLFLWALLCSVLGVIFYPSFANIDLNQMRSFRNLFYNIKLFFPSISDLLFLKGWLLYRSVKVSIAYTASSYLISFWVYHLYYRDWKVGIRDLKKALILAAILMISYSTIEVGFLCGSYFCKNILAQINVRIFDVASGDGWWPPLFWDRLQLRSLFPEPSFLCIFLAMAIPLFFSEFFNNNKKFSLSNIFVYFCFVMMLFMSKARTGTIIFGVEFFLFLCWACFYASFTKREKYKGIGLFVGCTALAFVISLGIMANFKSIDNKVSDSRDSINVSDYVRNNVTSITGNQRSNSARKTILITAIKVGVNHPIFGVGIQMRQEYVANQLTVEDKNSVEVNRWLSDMLNEGPMQAGFPDSNHFAVVFAEQGLIGLGLFIYPTFILLLKFFLQREQLKYDKHAVVIMIALIGLNMALLSNEDQIGFFIIIGLMMSIVVERENCCGERN